MAGINFFSTYRDQAGNESIYTALFSEPVWKVKCSMARGKDFPYPDHEITWLGRVRVPSPGEFQIINSPSGQAKNSTATLTLFGSGHYSILGGKISSAPSSPDINLEKPFVRFQGPNSYEINVTEPGLLLRTTAMNHPGREGGPPFIFARGPQAAERQNLTAVANDGFDSLLCPPRPFHSSEVEIGFVEVREFKTEFTVAAPSPPPPN